MGANTSDSEFLDGLGRGRGRGRGVSLLVKQNPNDAGSVVWGDFFFDEVDGGGVTGTASTNQAQTISASGSFALSAVSGAIATSQAQTLSAAGSFVPLAVSGAAATSQAQSAAATGSFSTGGVSGTIATSQAQTVLGSGTAAPQSVSGIGSTSQGQTTAGTGSVSPQAVTGNTATSQGQTASGTGSANPQAVSGVIATSQAQTVSGSGDFVGSSGVNGAGSTAQAQTTNGSGDVVNPEIELPTGFNGGFIMRKRKVYVKRGKQYLIFNNNEEADAYLDAEEAIETAKKSSRGAARRKIKALKVVKPEIAPEPKLEELSDLLAKFDVKYDLPAIAKNNDMELLYHIQSMLYALQQDEDDIELLLLAI